jgi:transposase
MNATIANPAEGKSARVPVEAGMIVKFGLDVHAAQITVCRQIEDQLPQPAQKLSWPQCLESLAAHAKTGAVVHSCYEAGPCGYGLHRQLEQLKIKNLVVAPQRWDERGQRVKTDRRDARALCERLDRHVRGNTAVFSLVRVPTPEQERDRTLGRERAALLKQRQRCVLRGHGLMLAQGLRAPEGWWRPAEWLELAPTLPAWLRETLRWWQQEAVRHDEQAQHLTGRIEALGAGAPVPKGVGTLTATLLRLEMIDWQRFKNRRQVSSYTGLCPGENSSGERRRQGAINKCGNPRVRHLLIEAAWRLPYWQPDYAPVRKRLVVALARRLAVDLWRIHTGQCSAGKLGLRLQTS